MGCHMLDKKWRSVWGHGSSESCEQGRILSIWSLGNFTSATKIQPEGNQRFFLVHRNPKFIMTPDQAGSKTGVGVHWMLGSEATRAYRKRRCFIHLRECNHEFWKPRSFTIDSSLTCLQKDVKEIDVSCSSFCSTIGWRIAPGSNSKWYTLNLFCCKSPHNPFRQEVLDAFLWLNVFVVTL